MAGVFVGCAFRVVFVAEMVSRRANRVVSRAINDWLNWVDEESPLSDGEDVFALRSLFARAEEVYDRAEASRFMRGEHLSQEGGAHSERARFIRGMRAWDRELEEDTIQRQALLGLEDQWALQVLFGDRAPDAEQPLEEDWDLESWV